MQDYKHYLNQLLSLAKNNRHRFGVCLQGDNHWQTEFCSLAASTIEGSSFQLGGEELPFVTQFCSMGKGQKLLGHECHLLIIDLSAGFDANSITSVLGTLCGGGLAIFTHSEKLGGDFGAQWLLRALTELVVLEQHAKIPSSTSFDVQVAHEDPYSQQAQAIELVHKVVTGHRRRPLVLTADRGRGKTSALGIAAAQLMASRNIRIVVTAPTIHNIAPLFEHAKRLLPKATQNRTGLIWQQSSIEFVAPDELLRQKTECDLLLVDEAAAIPLPMLINMVERFHRAVFATTVHGYEGCGRGFTLKFQSWLNQHRPNSRFEHITSPIRWADNDPLEQWQFKTFLLDYELQPFEVLPTAFAPLAEIDKESLFTQPQLLAQCFALLVNAHYQTTPNDLMLLLSDSSVKLFASFFEEQCIACIVAVEEGGFEQSLSEDIMLGRRRPKGHLVASSLCSILADSQPGMASSLRVMRIAVHLQLQNQGIGSRILSELSVLSRYDYLSTSFGVTGELLHFWLANGFRPLRLGTSRDQSSGTHSLIMVKGEHAWIEEAVISMAQDFTYQLKECFVELDANLIVDLLAALPKVKTSLGCLQLTRLKAYANGGSSFENIAALIEAAVLTRHVDKNKTLLIRRVLQLWDWQQCAEELSLPGRKQVEAQLRQQLESLLSTCKA